jgi:hypothetical protein
MGDAGHCVRATDLFITGLRYQLTGNVYWRSVFADNPSLCPCHHNSSYGLYAHPSILPPEDKPLLFRCLCADCPHFLFFYLYVVSTLVAMASSRTLGPFRAAARNRSTRRA